MTRQPGPSTGSASLDTFAFPPAAIEMTETPSDAAAPSSPSSPSSLVSPTEARDSSPATASPLPAPTQTTTDTPASPAAASRERRFSITATNLPRRLSKSFMEAELPAGFLTATADMSSSVFAAARPRSSTARTRSTVSSGSDGQRQRAMSRVEDGTSLAVLQENHRTSTSMDRDNDKHAAKSLARSDEETVRAPSLSAEAADGIIVVAATGKGISDKAGAAAGDKEYANGYHFPPKYSTGESLRQGAAAFWKFSTTFTGFLVVIYGLNVVAWGAMLFFLLLNVGPDMCHPTCGNIQSPRRKWIEVDSQILNAFFCVTGFGLAPWRFRDLYYLLRFRIAKSELDLRRLAGVHRGWIRLPGSDELPIDVGPGRLPADTPPSAIPFPASKIPDAPLTGERAPPTKLWHVDFILWMNVSNTLLQCVLSGFMWGMNRYDRPSWSTGLFVALGCIVGAVGGIGQFIEGKRIKGIEGVPLTSEDYAKLARDRERGVVHYNNFAGKKPKAKGDDVEAV